MKNNFYHKLIFFFTISLIYCSNVYSEQFDFRVKEIEILNNGNLFKGQDVRNVRNYFVKAFPTFVISETLLNLNFLFSPSVKV